LGPGWGAFAAEGFGHGAGLEGEQVALDRVLAPVDLGVDLGELVGGEPDGVAALGAVALAGVAGVVAVAGGASGPRYCFPQRVQRMSPVKRYSEGLEAHLA
jgi:hypothetical protein